MNMSRVMTSELRLLKRMGLRPHVVSPSPCSFSDGQASPDRADTIYDTTASDLIDAGGGNDTVWKQRSGDDILSGDAGTDRLEAGGGGNTMLSGMCGQSNNRTQRICGANDACFHEAERRAA